MYMYMYLKSLTSENIYSTKNLSILCLDVVALYPNASRELTLIAIQDCLTQAEWNPNAIEPFIELVDICMNEIYINFNGNTYTAATGIITGGPNSVSLANCIILLSGLRARHGDDSLEHRV